MYQNLPLHEQILIYGKRNNAEAMWKQIFQIQKYYLVNWKLKLNINPRWEINTIEYYCSRKEGNLVLILSVHVFFT